MTKVISFASGKGGVGKTTLVSNLGSLWAAKGKKTLLIDGDWTLGKLGIVLGARPVWTVDKALGGEIPFEKVILPISENLDLLPSPSGVLGFEELSAAQRTQLFYEIERSCESYDLILFDHASGVDWSVIQFAAAAHQHVIVMTTEPTSYTDAYAIMKILSKRFALKQFSIVVTMSERGNDTDQVVERFLDHVRESLLVRADVLEVLPWEAELAQSVRRRQPYVLAHPHSILSKRLGRISQMIERSGPHQNYGLRFFYSQMLGIE